MPGGWLSRKNWLKGREIKRKQIVAANMEAEDKKKARRELIIMMVFALAIIAMCLVIVPHVKF